MLIISDHGDFSATIAAILLHSEACSVGSLDADSFKGNLREPLLKMAVLMEQASMYKLIGIISLVMINNMLQCMAYHFTNG